MYLFPYIHFWQPNGISGHEQHSNITKLPKLSTLSVGYIRLQPKPLLHLDYGRKKIIANFEEAYGIQYVIEYPSKITRILIPCILGHKQEKRIIQW